MKFDNLQYNPESAKKDAPVVDDKLQSNQPEHSPELSYIAREVAVDHRVSVSIGTKDAGSYANLETREIVLDAGHVEKSSEARFVAAHEGAHLRDTPSPKELGISKERLKELSAKVGIFALKNVIEDGAINDRFVRDFEGLKNDTLESYPRSTNELGFIDHPEVMAIAQKLGFVPRFAQGLSAILTDWSELRHNFGFQSDVNEYLSKPYQGPPSEDPDINKFISDVIPEAREAISKIYSPGATGEQILLAGKTRHILCERVIYPELAELFEKDLQQAKENLEKGLSEAFKNILSSDAEQDSEKDNQTKPDGSPKENSDSEPQDSIGSKEKVNSESEPQVSKGNKAKENTDSPSDQNKKTDAELERMAKEVLAELDDAIRDALKSMFDKQDDAPSTKETIQGNNKKEEAEELKALSDLQFQDGAKMLKDALLRNLSPYQSYYFEVSNAIDEAYNRLIDVFVPNTHFSWQSMQSSGPGIDMVKAMQFEATGHGVDKLFKRRISPKRPDMNVAVLIDRSGSMAGERIEQAVKGAIFTKELFQRIGVNCACIGFSDEQQILLNFEDDIQDPENQEKMMTGLKLCGGTQDAQALIFTGNLLKQQNTKNRVIVMISDAQSGEGDVLPLAVKLIEKEGTKIIHFGIGQGTTDENSYYTKSLGDLEVSGSGDKNFFKVFCAEMENLALELF